MDMSIKKRNGAIDFWKFVFSVSLVIFHSANFAEIKNTPFAGGSILVEFFFLVSGFLMAESVSRYKINDNAFSNGKYIRKFMFHKVCGIAPEIFIAWIIGFLVQHITANGMTLKIVFKDLLTSTWDLLFLWEAGMEGFHANGGTWYISAMLLAMLLLLPLFFKNRDLFLNVWAPLISIFILGYISKTIGNLRAPLKWLGFCYSGLLRAIAEIALGCICWNICQWVKNFQYKKFAKLLFTILELCCYLGILTWSYHHKGSQMDFILLLMFAIAVTITFSRESIISPAFDNRFIYFLGKISFPIYLGHGYWSRTVNRIFPDQSYEQLLPKYLIIVALTSVIIYWLSKQIRKIGPQFLSFCKKYLLEEI